MWTRISVACFEQQSAFFIDGLDLLSVASKADGHGRSVTASELRWLYRHRHMPDVKNSITFWKNYKKTISGRCFFVAPVADISSEKNLSVGTATGVFNKQKSGKGNHELLLSRGA